MSRPTERRETGEQDLFRSRLDQIIDLKVCCRGTEGVQYELIP